MPLNRINASFILLAAFLASSAHAETGVQSSIETRTDSADEVAVVDVQDLKSEMVTNEHGDQLIVTHAKLGVREVLKGKFQEAAPEMTIEGGTVGDVTLNVSDQPKLTRGERLVVFLKKKGERHRPVRRGEGIVRVKGEKLERVNIDLSELRKRVRSRR